MADSANAAGERRVCVVCNKSGVELPTGSGLKRCGRCQKVTYCSKGLSAVAVATLSPRVTHDSLYRMSDNSLAATQGRMSTTDHNKRQASSPSPPQPPPLLHPIQD